MIESWFTAIYNNTIIEFKFDKQVDKLADLNCWITTKTGDRMFVNVDDMIFGELRHLTRLLNEKTIP